MTPIVSMSCSLITNRPLGHIMPTTPKETMRSILAEVAQRHGLRTDDLRGRSLNWKVAHPRQEAMWRIRQTGRYTLPQIGAFLGGRDHTTVLHGVRRHQARLDAGKAKL